MFVSKCRSYIDGGRDEYFHEIGALLSSNILSRERFHPARDRERDVRTILRRTSKHSR